MVCGAGITEAHPKPPSVTSPSPAPQQLKQKAVTLSQNTIPTKPTTQKAKPASAQPEAPPGRIVETLHQEGEEQRGRHIILKLNLNFNVACDGGTRTILLLRNGLSTCQG